VQLWVLSIPTPLQRSALWHRRHSSVEEKGSELVALHPEIERGARGGRKNEYINKKRTKMKDLYSNS
jgi:hypothetical protein